MRTVPQKYYAITTYANFHKHSQKLASFYAMFKDYILNKCEHEQN